MKEIPARFLEAVTSSISMINDPRAQSYFKRDHESLLKVIQKAAWQAKKIKASAERNSAISVYGPSQAGKSSLVSVLAGPDEKSLKVEFSGNEDPVDYSEKINPGGDGESTGIVTRFTVNYDHKDPDYPVVLKLLTETDLVCILVNSFFLDGNQKFEKIRDADELRVYIDKHTPDVSTETNAVSKEDFWELEEYYQNFSGFEYAKSMVNFIERIGNIAVTSDLKTRAALYAPLWGFHDQFTNLFLRLSQTLQTLSYEVDISSEISSLIPKEDSIIDVKRLREVMSSTSNLVSVKTSSGKVVSIEKALLTAVTSELILKVEELPHDFMKTTDLLDFPGARSRDPRNLEETFSVDASDEQGTENTRVDQLFLRGKVAYLFEKYVNAQDINAMLFCLNHKPLEVSGLADLLRKWVENSLGDTPEKRLGKDNMLFFTLTYFDAHLGDTAANVKETTRFKRRIETSLTEKFGGDKNSWVNNWDGERKFQNCFWYRYPDAFPQPYFKKTNGLEEFIATQNELLRVQQIKEMYLSTKEVQEHFADPEAAWEAAMKANDGGASYLLENLAKVCSPDIKVRQLAERAMSLSEKIENLLQIHYVPTDFEERRRGLNEHLDKLKTALEQLRRNNQFARFLEEFFISENTLLARAGSQFVTNVEQILDGVSQTWFEVMTENSARIAEAYALQDTITDFIINELNRAMKRETLDQQTIARASFLDFGGVDENSRHVVLKIGTTMINDFVAGRISNGHAVQQELVLSPNKADIESETSQAWYDELEKKAHANIMDMNGHEFDEHYNAFVGDTLSAMRL